MMTAAILLADCVPSAAEVRAAVTGSAVATGAQQERLGPVHVLEPGFYGFNIESVYFSNFLWNDAARRAIDAEGAAALRFPGGDFSSYYDWRTGWIWPNFLTNPLVSGVVTLPPGATSLGTFAALSQATGTFPVYALNVKTRTTNLDENPAIRNPDGALITPAISARELAAAQSDQIAMLRRAGQHYALPVRFVELGNELFWNASQGEADNDRAYTGGAEYGTQMNSWIGALRGTFANAVRIAAVGAIAPGGVGAIPRPGTARIANWNSGMLANIRGIDAVTLHRYDEATWDTDPVNVLGLAARDWSAIQATTLPPLAARGLGAWFTEYGGFTDDTGYLNADGSWRIRPRYTGTWLRGLYDAEMAVQFLADPRVEQVDFYNLTDVFFQTANQQYYVAGNPPPNAQGPTGGTITFDNPAANGLTAIGQAYRIVGRALAGATIAQQVAFPGAPEVIAPSGVRYPAITGIRLIDPGQFATPLAANRNARWLLLNLSARAWSVPSDRACRKTVERLWSPSLMTHVNSDTSLHHDAFGAIGKSAIVLPPYSVDLITTGA
jgi:hypothetical protein